MGGPGFLMVAPRVLRMEPEYLLRQGFKAAPRFLQSPDEEGPSGAVGAGRPHRTRVESSLAVPIQASVGLYGLREHTLREAHPLPRAPGGPVVHVQRKLHLSHGSLGGAVALPPFRPRAVPILRARVVPLLGLRAVPRRLRVVLLPRGRFGAQSEPR